MLLLLECVLIYNLKVDIIFPSKVATKGQKMHVIIQMDEVDKLLVYFNFDDLKLDIYGRYRDDTYIPLLYGIDDLLNSKQALDEHIKSIYLNINFTIIYD